MKPTAYIAVLFALFGAVLSAPVAAQSQAAVVLVERVEVREIKDTRPVIAQLTGTLEASVASRSAGVAEVVLFDVGDRVEEGQELVRLDNSLAMIAQRTAEAALATAAAGVAVAEARLKRAEQAFARQSRLQGSTAFSRGIYEDLEAELSEAQSEITRATAQVGESQAAMARAEYDLTHSRIRAPFTGVVVERDAQPGQYLALGDPVATVLDTARMEIAADIPVEMVPAMARGARISASMAGAEGLVAIVRTVLPRQNVSTQTREVRLSVDLSALPAEMLADGKSVVLQVPVTAPREAPTVPKDALVEHRGGWIVYVVEDGAAQRRSVSLGLPNGDRIEVLDGLSPGETVVVRGNERLREGQPVVPRVAQAGAATDGG
ncbi:MAG: efflux RND transporter periplasmic adaptor subunit [Pseudomonadota bacterium]